MKSVSNAMMADIVAMLGRYAALLSAQPEARSLSSRKELRKIKLILRRHGGTKSPKL